MFTRIPIGYSGGDCTSTYRVILDREYTVEEFINIVLKNYSNEWGHIDVVPHEIPKSQWICTYGYGKLTSDPLTSGYLNRKVVQVAVNGRWSRMDYSLLAADYIIK